MADWMEHNGHVNALFAVRARLTVAQCHLHFEFTGVPQTNGLINATESTVLGYVTSVLSMMLFWDLPVNQGLRRVFTVSAARGSILAAVEPAPVSAAHMDGSEKALTCAARLVAQAMSASSDPELQKRACAPYGASVSLCVFAGLDDSGDDEIRARRLLSAQHSGELAMRRTRLADALADNGAYVAPRDDVELVEAFDTATGRSRDVVYTADRGAPVSLPPADHRVL
jgi:N-methylhydantoinase B/oxoprolinase/acetone carboxylase alpha subunit